MSDGTITQTAVKEGGKPARYLFDEVFALDPVGVPAVVPAAPPPISREELAEAVARAREEGRAAGLAEGRRAADEAIAARLAAGVERLVAAMTALAARAEADRAAIEATAVDLAMTAVGRLAPALVAREPTGELSALLRGCLAGIRDVPHIAVRVSEDLVEPMRAEFDRVAAETGFAGRIVVLGEPDIAPGDGRIDWADGGIVRDMTETRKAVEAAVARFLATRPGQNRTPKDETDE